MPFLDLNLLFNSNVAIPNYDKCHLSFQRKIASLSKIQANELPSDYIHERNPRFFRKSDERRPGSRAFVILSDGFRVADECLIGLN